MRTGKFRIGMNALQTLKSIKLMIVCKTASDNTKEKALGLSKKYKCPILITQTKTLDELTHRENAKVMAISDTALAQAIYKNSEKDFIAVN